LKLHGDIIIVPFPTIDKALIPLLPVMSMPLCSRNLFSGKSPPPGIDDKIKVVGKPLMELKCGFLLCNSDVELLAKLNSALQE